MDGENLYRTDDQLLPVHASGKAETKINAWTCKEGSLDTLCERWGWADLKQRAALQALQEEKEMLRSQFYQIYKTPGKKLVELGLAQVYEKEVQARLLSKEITQQDLPLHPEQQQALHILQKVSGHEVVLLHGATGSGKTEVFLQLARSVMQQGKQVLILVPEISLTPQMVNRVTARFGSHVAIYHSGLNAQEKYEQYQLVRRHRCRIVGRYYAVRFLCRLIIWVSSSWMKSTIPVISSVGFLSTLSLSRYRFAKRKTSSCAGRFGKCHAFSGNLC